MAFHTIRRMALALFLAALCCVVGFILTIRNPSVQHYGLNRVSRAIGFTLNTGSIGFSLGRKPGIHIQDVHASSTQGTVLISASELTLFPNLSDLFLIVNSAVVSGSVDARNLKFRLAGSGETKYYTLPQAIFQGKYDLKKHLIEIDSLKIITSGAALSAAGQVLLNPAASPYLDLSVTSPFMTVDTFNSLLPPLMLPAWIDSELLPAMQQGDIRMDAIILRGTLEQIETLNQPEHASVIGLNMTLRNMVIQHPEKQVPEIRDVSGALRIKDGALSLDGLSGRIWQSAFQNTSVVIPDIYAEHIRYLARIEASIALSDVRLLKNLPVLPADFQQNIREIQTIDGIADIRVSVAYETGQPFPKIITSAVSLQSVKMTDPRLRLPIMIEKASIDAESDRQLQFSGQGLWGKSEFQVRGTADSDWNHISAKAATRADVKELITLALPHAAIGEWSYGPLVAEGILDEDGATLDPGKILVGKGYLQFKGRQNIRPETSMHWISHVHIVHEPAQNLFQIVKPGESLLDGSVTVEGVLTLKDPDGTGTFSGLNGHAGLLVEKGWIHQTSPILNALALISLEHIFKQDNPGVQNGRLYFDRIAADIEIDKGKILVRNLTMQSPAVNAAGAGTIDLNRDQLQIKIGLQPLGTVDSLVRRIPLLGKILTGKEKSLVVYSLEISGSLSNPQVKNVPFKNIGKSALGYLERMVFSPERILNSLTSLKNPRPPAPDYQAEFDRMTPSDRSDAPAPVISAPR
jgi:hypothetical protein